MLLPCGMACISVTVPPTPHPGQNRPPRLISVPLANRCRSWGVWISCSYVRRVPSAPSPPTDCAWPEQVHSSETSTKVRNRTQKSAGLGAVSSSYSLADAVRGVLADLALQRVEQSPQWYVKMGGHALRRSASPAQGRRRRTRERQLAHVRGARVPACSPGHPGGGGWRAATRPRPAAEAAAARGSSR